MDPRVAELLTPVLAVLIENDGSLPELQFDFGDAPVLSAAYSRLRTWSTHLDSLHPFYWSRTDECERAFTFDDTPTDFVMSGDADSFNVVFGGTISPSGYAIPPLGFQSFAAGDFSVNYRMGPEWTIEAVHGLFEFIESLMSLAPACTLTHAVNWFDYDGDIMLRAFACWCELSVSTNGLLRRQQDREAPGHAPRPVVAARIFEGAGHTKFSMRLFREVPFDYSPVVAILGSNDGSLPDIEFDFHGAPLVAKAYETMRAFATCLSTRKNSYWSEPLHRDVTFDFEDNPAEALVAEQALSFHVVFDGLRSPSGHPLPEFGMHVLEPDFFSLDYRMGPEWDSDAVEGLFHIMLSIRSLSNKVTITHKMNEFDKEDRMLLDAFDRWRMTCIA